VLQHHFNLQQTHQELRGQQRLLNVAHREDQPQRHQEQLNVAQPSHQASQLRLHKQPVLSEGDGTIRRIQNKPHDDQYRKHVDLFDSERREFVEGRFRTIKRFEMEKLSTMRTQRADVKMNLRGRAKIESWLLTAAPNTLRAVYFLVTLFSLDFRLMSKDDQERKIGLRDMSNFDLRLCEALMSRISSRDGAENCEYLVLYRILRHP
jgi:hypothetical protein